MNKYINKNIQWMILAIFSAAVIFILSSYDMTQKQLVGDQASHILQALSIANDFDLKYDLKDEIYWKGLAWTDNPNGLFFQKYSQGYAFAKPYAYSLFLSPFVLMFDIKGFIAANLLIFFLLNLFIYLTLIKYYTKNISIIFTIAFSLFSYVYMYVFTVHSDLFLAFLMSVFVYIATTLLANSNRLLFFSLSVLIAFMLSDKIALVFIMAPITLYLFKYYSKRDIGIFIILFIISFVIFLFPYLYYSDFHSWNPYSGLRYYSRDSVPFYEKSELAGYWELGTKKFFKLEYLIDNIFSLEGVKTKLTSFYYYFFGSYTGMLVYIPLSFIIIFISIYRSFTKPNLPLLLVLFGLFSYILFYIILFPHNYYGGLQSLGNRYFLQIAPITIFLLLLLKLDKIKSLLTVLLSFCLSLIFLYRHHVHPQDAYGFIFKTGYFQNMMPFEKTLSPLVRFFPPNQKVNLSLIPKKPNFFVNGREHFYFYYDVNKDSMLKHNEKYLKSDELQLRAVDLGGITVFINKGFYNNEKTHIWSQKRSALLLKNNGKTVMLLLSSFAPKNKLKVTVNREKHIMDLKKTQALVIDTKKFKENWILISFSALLSQRPYDRNPAFSDRRDLSFKISIKETVNEK